MTRYQELDIIADNNGGVLIPEDVVEYAKSEDSALHGSFEWDDSEAARKYRIAQAQEIIRCYCVDMTIRDNKVKRVRAYQSLPSGRSSLHPYKKTEDCLSNPDWRSEMLRAALKELSAFREKYEILSELEPLFSELDKISA